MFSFLILSSCGYQFGQGSLPQKYHTISVPYVKGDYVKGDYVKGDYTGKLTAELIHEIARSGAFRYDHDCGELILQTVIVDYKEENIGFRYDRDKELKRTHSIIPIETRATILAEVSVIDSRSGCVVQGPARISADVDFDHDYYFSRDIVNRTSLGQVADIDEARDAVLTPLNKILAEKIVDYVIHSW